MKILHIISSVYRAGGGTSEVVPRLCRALRGQGHDVVLAVVNFGEVSNSAKDAIASGVQLVQFPVWPCMQTLAASPEMKQGLKRLISQSDIVHLHGLWQAPCWYAAAECLRQGKPYVMMPHGFLEPERLKISKWKKRIIGWLVENRNLRHANALVATSESEATGIRAYGLTNPIHIMPIGIDLDKFKTTPTTSVCSVSSVVSTKKTLLFFSRITPIKGLDMLVEAWSHLKEFHNNWQLVLTGPDDRGYTKQLQSYITSLGLSFTDESKSQAEVEEGNNTTISHSSFLTSHSETENSTVNLNLQPQPKNTTVDLHLKPTPTITFTGPVYGEAKYAALHSSSAFVLPTRSENWSIAVAEAMVSCLPVVCTKGAPWSCLNECNAGHWVDISTSAIEQAIRSLLSLSDSERRAMGERGRAWVEKNLSWPTIASSMLNFYNEIIHRSPSPLTFT